MTAAVVLVAGLSGGATSHAARRDSGIDKIRGLPAAARSAILDLHPSFRRVYRQARQLEQTTIDNYRPVGDVTGDGTPEILISRWDLTFDPAGIFLFPNGTFTGTLLNGGTGKTLWSREAAFVDGFAGMRPFNVGADGKPGLLLLQSNGFSSAFTAQFTAVDATGTDLWTKVLTSTYNWQTGDRFLLPAGGATDALIAADVVDVGPGPAEDLLIGQADYVLPPGSKPVAMTDVSIIKGEDGTQAVVPVSELSTEQIPLIHAEPDLDGDGSDDFVFLGDDDDDDGHLVAHSALDGAVIWSRNMRLRPWPWADPIGDFLGDSTSDLLVGYDTRESRIFTVVDGSNGKPAWSVSGIFPYLAGDIDNDGAPDLGMMDLSGNKDRFLAYSNDGKRLYSVNHSPDMSECKKDFCFSFGFYLNAGDLDSDGARDTYVELSTSWSSEKTRYFVTGRTGRPLYEGKGNLVPVRGAVDGRGDDVGSAKKLSRNRLGLTISDGRTLRSLWRVTITGAVKFADSYTPYGAALNHNSDRCADVLVGVRKGETLTLVMLDGRNGSPVWKRSIGDAGRVRVESRRLRRSPCS